jgi:hypothetical protein
MLSDEGRGMLLSYRKKLDTRSESRKRAFDHHDMLDT